MDKQKRVSPMEILNLGMPRTGTMCKYLATVTQAKTYFFMYPGFLLLNIHGSRPYIAMHRALKILGINCYHGITMFSRTSDCDIWNQALDAKFFAPNRPASLINREHWDQLLGDFGAVSDVPAVAFAEDLVHAYPEAKVILVERDLEKWYHSFDEAVVKACFDPTLNPILR